MSNIFNFEIFEDLQGQRIDKILADLDVLKKYDFSRSKIQDLVKNGFLKKNSILFTNISYKVKLGDIFELSLPEFEEKKIISKDIKLDIVYEDDDLLVINKQAGLTSHPGAGNETDTLVNALLNIYPDNLSKIGGEFRQGIIHRLDKDTTGLMVVAKNDVAHLNLSNQLHERVLKRNYIAFLWGVLKPTEGSISGYIQRSKINRLKMEMTDDKHARFSLTNYKTIQTFLDENISKVEFNLDTGRTHQIRVHTSSLKHPLVGDSLYGGKARHLKNNYNLNIKNTIENFSRQALHSYKISFKQPTSSKLIALEVELPDDMKRLEETLLNN